MARRNRNSCNGYYNFTFIKVGGMQLFKMEGPDTTEKILPRTIEVAAIIISTYVVLTLLCGLLYWAFWNDNF